MNGAHALFQRLTQKEPAPSPLACPSPPPFTDISYFRDRLGIHQQRVSLIYSQSRGIREQGGGSEPLSLASLKKKRAIDARIHCMEEMARTKFVLATLENRKKEISLKAKKKEEVMGGLGEVIRRPQQPVEEPEDEPEEMDQEMDVEDDYEDVEDYYEDEMDDRDEGQGFVDTNEQANTPTSKSDTSSHSSHSSHFKED